jgi:hypothetical protein
MKIGIGLTLHGIKLKLKNYINRKLKRKKRNMQETERKEKKS